MLIRSPSFVESLAVAKSFGKSSEAPNLWNGLRANWPFLQGGGSTLYDIAGESHGTLTNMDPSTDWVMTEKGWALRFAEASSQYIDLGITPALDIVAPLSIVVRYRNTVGTDGDVFVCDLAFSGYQYGIEITAAGKARYKSNQAGVHYTEDSNFTNAGDGNWHTTVVTHGDEIAFYQDGVFDRSEAKTAPSKYVGATVNIARDNWYPNYFDGDIASAMLYNRVLTSSEIRQLRQDPHAMHRKRPTTVAFADAGGAPPTVATYKFPIARPVATPIATGV